mmetsp:Transcript_93226/g.268436  ORF Transcript_93226/g.268436 Transcript_93226/m.268436 type:complete len:357 (-) Transcript_93226:7-1077(-)
MDGALGHGANLGANERRRRCRARRQHIGPLGVLLAPLLRHRARLVDRLLQHLCASHVAGLPEASERLPGALQALFQVPACEVPVRQRVERRLHAVNVLDFLEQSESISATTESLHAGLILGQEGIGECQVRRGLARLVALVLAHGEHLRRLLDGRSGVAPGQGDLRDGVHRSRGIRAHGDGVARDLHGLVSVACLPVQGCDHAQHLCLTRLVTGLGIQLPCFAERGHRRPMAITGRELNLGDEALALGLFCLVRRERRGLLRELHGFSIILLRQMNVNRHPQGFGLAIGVTAATCLRLVLVQQSPHFVHLRQAEFTEQPLGLLERGLFASSHGCSMSPPRKSARMCGGRRVAPRAT